MIVWRVANARYADLSGQGGLHGPGRWHSQGRPIVYTAEHPSLALLETRVHMNVENYLLANYVLLKIDTADLEIADAPDVDLDAMQAFGDAWLAGGETSLLRVPSVVVPESFNVLLNPLHPAAGEAKVVETRAFDVDRRLFG